MIDVQFEVAGRKISLDGMNPGLQRSMLATIREALGERVGDVECPHHHCAPHILCKGPSVVELSMEISGCCDHIIDKVESRLQ